MNEYVPGYGVYVGTYTMSECAAGKDTSDFERAAERTGYRFPNTKLIWDKGVQKIEIWASDIDDYCPSVMMEVAQV